MSGEAPSGPRLPRRRVAIGPKRPQYLASREIDRVMMVVTALIAEVSALRDRLATHEALAGSGRAATAADVEAFRPDAGHEAARSAERTAMLRRVFRVITEEVDVVQQSGPDAATRSELDDQDAT